MLSISLMIKFPPNNYKIKKNNFEVDYIDTLNLVQKNLDFKKISKISTLFEETIKNDNNIFIIGNGGSAAVSNHFVCDFNKGLSKISNNKKVKFISLTNSIETITAISNDVSFNKIFYNQLENFYHKGDLIYIMSCSGTSPNIMHALRFCKKNNSKVVFVTGFLERKINYKFKVFINLNCKNYGICEDTFSTIMHITCHKFTIKYSKSNLKIL